MALSGVINVMVDTRWQVRLEWSATQNIANNTSTVTAKLYWESLYSDSGVNSSPLKDGYIIIDGNRSDFQVSAHLSGKQKKLLHTHSRTITHNANGTLTIPISGSFSPNVTLRGAYRGTYTPSGNITLDTIPRASSVTSNASWTAGSAKSVTISRASSSFTHTVRWQVQDSGGTWRTIRTATGVGTSNNGSFTVAENKNIFTYLAQRASMNGRIELETFSGSTKIGSTVYTSTGTVTSPNSSSTTFGGNFNIGATISGNITRANSEFRHTIQLIFGGTTYTLHTKTTATSWSYNTASIATSLYGKIPNHKSISGEIRIYTYYSDGAEVRSYKSSNLTATVINSDPTFTASQISYKDINTTTAGITGNDQYIIQGKSTFEARVISSATAKNSATIARYEITVNGNTENLTAIGTKNMGTVSASSNVTMSVKAVDSRGFFTTVTKTVNIVPYAPPKVVVKAERLNGFEAQTTIKVNGSASAIKVGTTNRNALDIRRRSHKLATASTYGATTNLTVSGFPTYTATNVNLTLDNVREWDIKIEISDKLSTTTVVVRVPVGRPIFYIDADKKSIGFNDIPTGDEEFRINGRIVFGSNQFASGAGSGEAGGGALFLNNSDITGVNGIFMNDISNNKGEGIHFLKTGKPAASTSNLDYDTWYIRDGRMYWDGNYFLGFDFGDSNGSALLLGAGGHTIIGGGESAWTWYENHSWGAGTEQMVVASDNSVWVITGLQGGFAGRQSFQFSPSGEFISPSKIISGGDIDLQAGGATNYVTGSAVNIRLATQAGEWLRLGSDSTSDLIQSPSFYNRTYGFSANLYVTSAGAIGRATSASKYKVNIREVETDEIAERILALQPKKWHDKKGVEAHAEYLTKLYNNEEIDEDEDRYYLRYHYGLIAEDLVDAGLGMFVEYGEPNENGIREVEGIEYDRVWTMLIPVVRNQKKKIDRLEARISKLENLSV